MGKRLIGSVGLKPGTDTGFDLDTKGQIHGYSDTQFALPVGDDDQVLTADSGEASGLKWATSGSGANTALSNLSSVAVNATIDMNSNILTNVGVGGFAKLEEIEAYEEASATGNTKTFTLAEDDLSLYDALVLTYNLTTTASFNLEIVVDGITSGYRYSVSEDAGATFTNTTSASQSEFTIMDSTLLSTDTITGSGQVLFMPSENSEGTDRCNVLFSGGCDTAGNAWGVGSVASPHTSFGSITIQTSTSSWTIHSMFNLMGRRK